MYSVKREKRAPSEDTFNDDSDSKDTKRKSRNLSEKKRRDQFNLLVNELSSIVSPSGRKMDKSTILKASIAFLKTHNEQTARSRIHEIQEDWKPNFLTNEEFFHLLLEAVHGFIIVFTVAGQIFYTSESIVSLLGYPTGEVLNANFYEMVVDEEQNGLYKSMVGLSDQDNEQMTFSCHLKCMGGVSEEEYLELVGFTGYFKSISEVHCDKPPDTRVFIGTGRLLTPQLIRDMPVTDSKSEFTSRHSLEWKFLFLDHRAPPIIGYLPFELLGTSGYDYYHVDDLDNVANCHEALMQKSEGTSCYYRFLTKGQQWIWLQTRFYITYHQWNAKPEFVVCSHRVVGYCDVMQQNRVDTIERKRNNWVKKRQRSADSLCSVTTQQSATTATSGSHPTPTPTTPSNFPQPTQQLLLHADLQRKHAELQASIGQQQAELLAVSEQLLMARFGLLSGQNVEPLLNASGTVSSTTLQPLVAVSSSELFEPPDSNTSSSSQNLTELKSKTRLM